MIFQYDELDDALNSYPPPYPLSCCIHFRSSMHSTTEQAFFSYTESLESNCVAYSAFEDPLGSRVNFKTFYNFNCDSLTGIIKAVVICEDFYHIFFTIRVTNSNTDTFDEILYVATQSDTKILLWCPTFLFIFKFLNSFDSSLINTILHQICEELSDSTSVPDIYNIINQQIPIEDQSSEPFLNLEVCFTALKEIMILEDIKYCSPNASGRYKILEAYEDLTFNQMPLDHWLTLYATNSSNSTAKITSKQDKRLSASQCLERDGYLNIPKFDLYTLRNEKST